jgi:hypothetical protein
MSVTPAELARRVRAHRQQLTEQGALGFLEWWRDRGVAEQDERGEWKLTAKGRDMFATFSLIDQDDRTDEAANK